MLTRFVIHPIRKCKRWFWGIHVHLQFLFLHHLLQQLCFYPSIHFQYHYHHHINISFYDIISLLFSITVLNFDCSASLISQCFGDHPRRKGCTKQACRSGFYLFQPLPSLPYAGYAKPNRNHGA